MMRAIAPLCLATTACLTTPDRPNAGSGCSPHQFTELMSTRDRSPWLAPDSLEIVFDRAVGNGVIMSARRTRKELAFDPPQPLPGLSMCNDADAPFLSTDALRIWFTCMGGQLWSAHRPTRDQPFEQAQPEPGFVNPPNGFSSASLDGSELTMAFAGNNGRIYFVTRASTAETFDAATAVEIPVTTASETMPSLSNDGNSLLFSRCHGAPCADYQIFATTRDTSFTFADEVTALQHVAGANDAAAQQIADGTIVFSSERVGAGMSAIFSCY